ncbi:hypothetical protein SAMN05444164_3201 [Bradyrhizobium erythrophlei]|uniref:Uncharacterized protein n=1 Tax=Bradyrhizobium erythrophlei TaxID=1437360 RepID=A0A1H4WPX5_9BRAD|nr:hypothetical protein SAMN05444164_3201 [Bradyrhizobium erythrophlei]
MRGQYVRVGQGLLFPERRERIVYPGREGGMFEPPYNRGILLLGKIA